MSRQIQHARLNDRDIEALTHCLTRLNRIHDSVNATGMAGKAAVMELASECYHVIEGLLAREQVIVQRYFARKQQTQETPAGQGDS